MLRTPEGVFSLLSLRLLEYDLTYNGSRLLENESLVNWVALLQANVVNCWWPDFALDCFFLGARDRRDGVEICQRVFTLLQTAVNFNAWVRTFFLMTFENSLVWKRYLFNVILDWDDLRKFWVSKLRELLGSGLLHRLIDSAVSAHVLVVWDPWGGLIRDVGLILALYVWKHAVVDVVVQAVTGFKAVASVDALSLATREFVEPWRFSALRYVGLWEPDHVHLLLHFLLELGDVGLVLVLSNLDWRLLGVKVLLQRRVR